MTVICHLVFMSGDVFYCFDEALHAHQVSGACEDMTSQNNWVDHHQAIMNCPLSWQMWLNCTANALSYQVNGKGLRKFPKLFSFFLYLDSVMQKGPQCPESFSYQKKDGLAWPTPFRRIKNKKSVSYQKKNGRDHMHPSCFWYDNDSGH